MSENNINKFNLELHPTKDIQDNHVNGSLTVIWRDWDEIIKNHPKMIYVSSVDSGEIKGPHIHTKRESYFTCIHGKVVFVIKKSDGTYDEIISVVCHNNKGKLTTGGMVLDVRKYYDAEIGSEFNVSDVSTLL